MDWHQREDLRLQVEFPSDLTSFVAVVMEALFNHLRRSSA